MNPLIIQLFRDALDLERAERGAYLDAHCSDPALRAQLDALLVAAEQTAAPLTRVGLAEDVSKARTAVDRSGELIGAFRLLKSLGQGGMGAVWLAERVSGFNQQVAIKWLHAGLSDSVRSRFARERETLAKLEHPGIARIVDGGSDGAADWFAMEYVDGVTLDQFVKSTQASLAQRIKLVITLCDAVQYAHQNLIVHRDLKPGNILVNANGQPKLLDFGVAKLLDDNNATESRAPMTFAYAAPEQIRGDAVTTATDVYALGVILFELLTGQRSHKPKGDGSLSLLQAVTDTDATAPSHVLSLRTNTETTIRPNQLKGDLDTIVLKALSRDPARRYGSAQTLSEDLQRFIAGAPITARADTARYRLGKWLKRNPVVALVSLVAVLGLLALTLVSVQQAQQAKTQRVRADAMALNAAHERDEALQQLRKQEALREHFLAVLNRATESSAAITPENLLALAANTELVQSAKNPQVQLALKLALAEMFLLRTDYPKTLELLDSIEPLLTASTELEKANAAGIRIYALIQTGDISAAEQALSKAEKLSLATTESDLARNLWVFRGQIAQAKGDLSTAVASMEKAAALAESDRTGSALDRGTSTANLAVLQLALGHYAAAQKAAERALAIWQAGGVADNVQAQTVHLVHATVLLQLGLAAQAKVAYAQLNVAGETPPAKAARLMSEARVAILLGEFSRAESLIAPAPDLMCATTGKTSMQCARALMATLEVQLNLDADAGTGKRIRQLMAQIQAIQTQAPSPANAPLLPFYAGLVAAHDVTNTNGISAALKAFADRAGENDAGRYGAARQALALAMRLRLQNRGPQAREVAAFAITLEPKLAFPDGSVDQCLMQLWRAELGGDLAGRTAALAQARALVGAHPWLRGW
jgi:tetratricopeptide (TPR) repeat protein/predicted Ser/Thr protein kinase